MTLSETQASRHPDDTVRPCSAGSGLPPITQITFPACRAHYPGGSNRCLSVCSSRFALAFPAHTTGRHPRLYVSRLAPASLALRPTVLLAHLMWTLSRGSSPDGYPSEPLVSYPGIPIPPGVGLSPTGDLRHRGARARQICGSHGERLSSPWVFRPERPGRNVPTAKKAFAVATSEFPCVPQICRAPLTKAAPLWRCHAASPRI